MESYDLLTVAALVGLGFFLQYLLGEAKKKWTQTTSLLWQLNSNFDRLAHHTATVAKSVRGLSGIVYDVTKTVNVNRLNPSANNQNVQKPIEPAPSSSVSSSSSSSSAKKSGSSWFDVCLGGLAGGSLGLGIFHALNCLYDWVVPANKSSRCDVPCDIMPKAMPRENAMVPTVCNVRHGGIFCNVPGVSPVSLVPPVSGAPAASPFLQNNHLNASEIIHINLDDLALSPEEEQSGALRRKKNREERKEKREKKEKEEKGETKKKNNDSDTLSTGLIILGMVFRYAREKDESKQLERTNPMWLTVASFWTKILDFWQTVLPEQDAAKLIATVRSFGLFTAPDIAWILQYGVRLLGEYSVVDQIVPLGDFLMQFVTKEMSPATNEKIERGKGARRPFETVPLRRRRRSSLSPSSLSTIVFPNNFQEFQRELESEMLNAAKEQEKQPGQGAQKEEKEPQHEKKTAPIQEGRQEAQPKEDRQEGRTLNTSHSFGQIASQLLSNPLLLNTAMNLFAPKEEKQDANDQTQANPLNSILSSLGGNANLAGLMSSFMGMNNGPVRPSDASSTSGISSPPPAAPFPPSSSSCSSSSPPALSSALSKSIASAIATLSAPPVSSYSSSSLSSPSSFSSHQLKSIATTAPTASFSLSANEPRSATVTPDYVHVEQK